MRLQLSTLMVAVAACAGVPALAQTCTPTAVTPYIYVNGKWVQTASATLAAGSSAILGPQPTR
ncbi:MAG: hypothetical protein ACJ8F0_19115, partial [Xanthobacteraceae bacterium]